MALSERTVNQHNLKRAEVFKANGLNLLDIAYAHPKFMGYGHGECILCGKQHLKWIFSLHFDAPSGIVALAKVAMEIDREGEVTLYPVGSKCIVDWLDAVPETPEKLEALRRWKAEMDRCKAAMRAKMIEDLCKEYGYATPQDAYNAFATIKTDYRRMRSVLSSYEINRLLKNAGRVRHKSGSRKTVKTWLDDLRKVLTAPVVQPTAPAVPAAPAAPAAPTLSQADQDLLDRGDKARVNIARLMMTHQNAFLDIAAKVRKHGKFVSAAQRGYYTDLLKKLEN